MAINYRNIVNCGIFGLVACGPSGPGQGPGQDTDGESADTSSGEAMAPTADETGGGTDAGSTDAASSDGEDGGSTGADATQLCFSRTVMFEAHSAFPISLASHDRADLALTQISVEETALLQLRLNEGNSWPQIDPFVITESGSFELFDANLDGLTDVVIWEGESAEYFRNVDGAFDDPEPLDALFFDATFVDFVGDGLPDVVKFLGGQVEVFLRDTDGSGQMVGTYDLPSPDPASPVGDSCGDWLVTGTSPSVNSPHSLRRFGRSCDETGSANLYDVIEFAPDGTPTWLGELPTEPHLSPRWVGDVDLDGALDVLESDGRLSRFVDGELVELVDFGSSEVMMGDLDGDGVMDAVAYDEIASQDGPVTATVRLGAEGWSVHTTIEGSHPEAIADFDGDGDNDILIHDWLIGLPYILSTEDCSE